MDILDYLQPYFIKALGVPIPVWHAISTIISEPKFLRNVMIKMALDRGFTCPSVNRSVYEYYMVQLNYGHTFLQFIMEENGFVITQFQEYDELEYNSKTWRMEAGEFFYGNRLVSFQEWMEKYERVT